MMKTKTELKGSDCGADWTETQTLDARLLAFHDMTDISAVGRQLVQSRL